MGNAIQIGPHQVGPSHPPFIVAEMSGNHNQSLSRALAIVEAAAKAGAHAIKIQTYTADTMTLDLAEGDFFISDPNSLWKGQSLYELYQSAHTPWEWHQPIFDRARELGIIPFSTPFDATAVDFLEELGVPCFKIASFENTDIPLIKRVAATGKPLIISTGMASIAELEESVAAARAAGCESLILLKCTSTYPADPRDIHIATIPHMRQLFRCEVGLSDHTRGLGVSVASVALGASMIEKHFTLDRSEGGVDAPFSAEPDELREMVTGTQNAWLSLGQVNYGVGEKETQSIIFRRSLYVVEDMVAGEMLTAHNVRAIRPGMGLAPKYFDRFLGKRVCKNVSKGTPLSWDLI